MATTVEQYMLQLNSNINSFMTDMNRAMTSMDNVGNKAKGLSSIIAGALSFAGGTALVKTIDALGNAMSAGVKKGIQFDSMMQQNKIAFESMLGSAEKADVLLEKLLKMAAETPFQFSELSDASKRLMAFGFEAERIPKILTQIGDAASGLSLGSDGVNRIIIALGQMSAKGRVMSQEMLQLTEAGIPVWDMLAKAAGTSTKEMMKLVEKGVVPAKESIDVLLEGMAAKFPNMMQKQSKSFAGMMSTLKDNTEIVLGQVVEPLFNMLANNVLPNVISKTILFQETYKKTGSIMQSIKAVMGGIFEGTKISEFSNKFSAAKGIFEHVKSVALNTFNTITSSIGNVRDRFRGLVQQLLPQINAAFQSLATDSIPKLITAGSTLVNGILPVMINHWTSLYENVLPVVVDIFEFIATEVLPKVADAAIQMAPVIVDIFKNISDIVIKSVKTLADTFREVWPAIKTIVLANIEVIISRAKIIYNVLDGLLKFIAGVFTADWQKAWEGIKQIFVGIFDGIKEQFTIITNFLIDGLNGIIGKVNDLGASIPTIQKAGEKIAEASSKIEPQWAPDRDWERGKKYATTPSEAPKGLTYTTMEAAKAAESAAKKTATTHKQTLKTTSSTADALKKALNSSVVDTTDKVKKMQDTFRNFMKEMKNISQGFANFGNMFERNVIEKFSPQKIQNRLKRFLDQMQKWQKGLNDLVKKGVSADYVNELRSMGLAGSGLVAGFNQMSPAQLKKSLQQIGDIKGIAGGQAYQLATYNKKVELSGYIELRGVNNKGQVEEIKRLVAQEVAKEVKNGNNSFATKSTGTKAVK